MKMASTLLILIVVDRIAVSKIKPFRIYQAQQSDVHNMQTWKGVKSSNVQDHFFHFSIFSSCYIYKGCTSNRSVRYRRRKCSINGPASAPMKGTEVEISVLDSIPFHHHIERFVYGKGKLCKGIWPV